MRTDQTNQTRILVVKHDVGQPDLLGGHVERGRVAVLGWLPLEHLVEPDLSAAILTNGQQFTVNNWAEERILLYKSIS